MLARLTRRRDMLKTGRFFNTFREHVAVYNMSASEFLTNRLTSNLRGFVNHCPDSDRVVSLAHGNDLRESGI